MDTPLLSDLCTSCHVEPPKYKCPRCRAQTCSLACYKRHQQRASCSGKRDPAAFVKKSQWATASGVDRDFNYLKGVERSIDDASRNIHQRGIVLDARRSKPAARVWQPDGLLHQYLTQNRIAVDHAPVGMSRQKTNNTRATKSGKVVWTVEWIEADGKRQRQDDCLASNSLLDLYRLLEAQRRNAEKRRSGADAHKAKRQKSQSVGDIVPQIPRKEHSINKNSPKAVAPNEPLVPLRKTSPKGAADALYDLDPSAAGENAEVQALQTAKTGDIPGPSDIADEEVPLDIGAAPTDEQLPDLPRYFYLLKPVTGSTSCTLIPMNAQHTLTAVLRDRRVQEYPTIYVLPDPPTKLPRGLRVEDDEPVAEGASARADPEGSRGDRLRESAPDRMKAEATRDAAAQPKSPAGASFDANAILDLLKRDVTT